MTVLLRRIDVHKVYEIFENTAKEWSRMSARRWGITTGLGLILFAVLLALTAFGVWKLGTWIGFFLIYSWVFNQITSYGLDSNLAKIASVVIGCVVWFGAIKLIKRNLGWGAVIIIVLIIAQSSFLYVMSRNRYFDPTSGSPTKFYTMNPVSGQYQLFDKPIYDTFGQQAVPVTAEVAAKIERRKNTNSGANDLMAAEKIEKFFDPESGQALVFYSQSPTGKYRLFNNPGYDPKTGQKLEPVTTEVMNNIITTKAPTEKPEKKGLLIFQKTDGAGKHTVCDFSGDYRILAGNSTVDSGAIKHGVSELNWWKPETKIKVQYRSWGGKYSTTDYCKLKNGHYIIVNFPPTRPRRVQAPATSKPQKIAAVMPVAAPAKVSSKHVSSVHPQRRVSSQRRISPRQKYRPSHNQKNAYNNSRAQQAYQNRLNQYYASLAARQVPTYYAQQVSPAVYQSAKPVQPSSPVVYTYTYSNNTYRRVRSADPGLPEVNASTSVSTSASPVCSRCGQRHAVHPTTSSVPVKAYVPQLSAYSSSSTSNQSTAPKPICPNCGKRH